MTKLCNHMCPAYLESLEYNQSLQNGRRKPKHFMTSVENNLNNPFNHQRCDKVHVPVPCTSPTWLLGRHVMRSLDPLSRLFIRLSPDKCLQLQSHVIKDNPIGLLNLNSQQEGVHPIPPTVRLWHMIVLVVRDKGL